MKLSGEATAREKWLLDSRGKEPIYNDQAEMVAYTDQWGNRVDDPGPSLVPSAVSTNGKAGPGVFTFYSAADHAAAVDARPPLQWLARPVWPADAYGVLAAEQKAGKTWAALDLLISVASGTPWLDRFPIQSPGPTLVFLGEGGDRKMLRRLRAICESRELRYEDLPIELVFRAPHLTDLTHLGAIADRLERFAAAMTPVSLVVVDPLYLAARGAKASALYEMGVHLENLQMIVQQFAAALVLIHHWNRSGGSKGSERMSGAGPAEWGRILVSTSVRSKHTDEKTRATMVTLDLKFEGDEIPDTNVRLRRRIWADDPDDLTSPLHYAVEHLAADAPDERTGGLGLTPADQRVHDVLRAVEGEWVDVTRIGDALATDSTGLKPLKVRTIQQSCKRLIEAGLIDVVDVPGTNAHRWCAQPADSEGGNAV